ncbi:MAG: tripartite tricarboxylate transporter substrate-binding protein, partial [Caldimonas sp.]
MTRPMTRPTWIALLGAALLLPLGAAADVPYPNRPIRMIVPLAAGSAVDVAARIVAQKMAATMGQSIVVENQPGASGLVGADRVAKAAPDGYTIGGFNDSIMTMVPALQAKMPWDIVRDFAPVSLVATVEWGLVANPATPYRNAAALIAAATAAPGKIDYGSGGIGSPQHIAMA